jgi:hypothetical protein
MRRRTLPALALLLGIVFMTGIGIWRNHTQVSNPEHSYFDAESPGAHTQEAEPDNETPARLHGRFFPQEDQDTEWEQRLELTQRFMSAKDAHEAQAVVDEIRNSGDSALANDLEFEIRGRCGFLDGYEPPYERTRWAHELILKYCVNYNPRSDVPGSIAVSEISTLAFNKLMKQLLELETGEFDPYFMEFLASTNNALELKAAESIAKDLLRSGAPLSFGMTQDRMVTPIEAEKVLDTAFELYGCVKFGGCEPYDFRVLEYCALTGNCEQGWSMFDIYRYTLAPNVYEQVTHVLKDMVNAGKSDN